MPSLGLAAYGPVAERFASSFSADDPVIVFDQSGAAEALRDCVWRSFRGDRFFVRPLLQRVEAARADAVAAGVMHAFAGSDERRVAIAQAFDGTLQANGRALREMPAYSAGALRLMQSALRLSCGAAVSSHAERRRLFDLLETDAPAVFRNLRDNSVPPPAEGGRERPDSVLIWAPELTGDAALSFAVVLADVHLQIVIVSATPPVTAAPGVRWIPFEERAQALKRARIIVVTNAFVADTAVALSAWKTPLVVDAESGAQEILEDARVFTRGRSSSIFDAVVSALGSPPARMRALPSTARWLEPDESLLSDGPLVSIIMPTFDRPALLQHALESCARQSYRNVETIVAAGGGARFDVLAAMYPAVRWVHLEENVPAASMNAAFAAAAGEYVTVLNDDDLFFPHHVATLVSALERSGGAAAHADVLTAYLRGDDEQLSLYGFESNMSRSADASSLLVANRIGATSAMIRRSCLPDQLLDMSIPYYRDYALWVGLAVQHDLIHVERITSCYTIRNRGAAQQSTTGHGKAVEAYEAIYARYPAPERPAIQQQRAQMLASVRAGGTALVAEPAMQIDPVQWPPF